MEFEVQVTVEDYIQYNVCYSLNSRMGRSSRLLSQLYAVIVSIYTIFVLFVAKADLVLIVVEAVFLAVISLIWFFVYPRGIRRRMEKKIPKLQMDGRLPFEERGVMKLDDEGLEFSAEGFWKRVPYSKLVGIWEDVEHFFIRTGAMEGMIVPKRCISAPGQMEQLREYLRGRGVEIQQARKK